MEKTEIKCDACGDDLRYTGNAEDWFLVLGNRAKEPCFCKDGLQGGMLTDMVSPPPIDRTHHFCDLGCLQRWMEKRLVVK